MRYYIYGIYFYDSKRIEYVGATKDLKRREKMHRDHSLGTGKLLDRDGILITLAVAYSAAERNKLEEQKIFEYDTYRNGLNQTKTGRAGLGGADHRWWYGADHSGENSPRYGTEHTVKSKAKMSAAKKGKSLTAEHKAKLSSSLKGVPKTAEHRANISASIKGEKHWNYGNRGMKHTAATRAKMSIAQKAAKRSKARKSEASEVKRGELTR